MVPGWQAAITSNLAIPQGKGPRLPLGGNGKLSYLKEREDAKILHRGQKSFTVFVDFGRLARLTGRWNKGE